MLKTGSKTHRVLQVILFVIITISIAKHLYDAKKMQDTVVEYGEGSFGGGGAGGDF